MAPAINILAISLFLSSVLSSVLPRAITIDYGKCKSPTITYYKGKGFFPANRALFDHEITKEIGPICDFICSQLQNKCAAPSVTLEICKTASQHAKMPGLTDQVRQVTFNNYIMYMKPYINPHPVDDVTPTPTVKPKPKPTPTPSPPEPKLGFNISTSFSSESVMFDGWVDPVWWINNKMIEPEGQVPAVCGLKPSGHKMPNGHLLMGDCRGEAKNVVPLMREALIAIVQATIKNDTLKDEERVFKYGTQKERICSDYRRALPGSSPNISDALAPNHVSPLPEMQPDEPEWTPEDEERGGRCWTRNRKYTRWPMEMLLVSVDYVGAQSFGTGDFHYRITEDATNNCKMCAFFAAGGAASAAASTATTVVAGVAAPLVGPGFAFGGAVVTLSCLAFCG